MFLKGESKYVTRFRKFYKQSLIIWFECCGPLFSPKFAKEKRYEILFIFSLLLVCITLNQWILIWFECVILLVTFWCYWNFLYCLFSSDIVRVLVSFSHWFFLGCLSSCNIVVCELWKCDSHMCFFNMHLFMPLWKEKKKNKACAFKFSLGS